MPFYSNLQRTDYKRSSILRRKKPEWDLATGLPSIRARWKPSALDSITLVEGKVSAVSDLSGNGFDAIQSIDSLRPSLEDEKLVFTGGQCLLPGLTLFDFAINGSFTIAYSISSWTAGTPISRSYNWGSLYSSASSTNYRFTVGRNGVDESNILRPIATNNNICIHSFDDVDNTHTARHNGVGYSVTYNNSISFNPLDIPSIGCLHTSSNLRAGFLVGNLEELIVIPEALNVSTMEKLEGYLAHEYNKTDNLPPIHPYKLATP